MSPAAIVPREFFFTPGSVEFHLDSLEWPGGIITLGMERQ